MISLPLISKNQRKIEEEQRTYWPPIVISVFESAIHKTSKVKEVVPICLLLIQAIAKISVMTLSEVQIQDAAKIHRTQAHFKPQEYEQEHIPKEMLVRPQYQSQLINNSRNKQVESYKNNSKTWIFSKNKSFHLCQEWWRNKHQNIVAILQRTS